MSPLRHLVPLAAAALAVFGSLTGMRAIDESIDSESVDAGDPSEGGPGEAAGSGSPPGTRAHAVAGDDRRSLLRAENFGRLLARLRQEGGSEAQISNLRLAPGEAVVQLKSGRGTQLLIIGTDAKVARRSELPVNSPLRTNLSRLKAGAPERIIRAIRERRGGGLADVDYMVALSDRWSVFLTGRRPSHYVTEDLLGRGVRAPGEPLRAPPP